VFGKLVSRPLRNLISVAWNTTNRKPNDRLWNSPFPKKALILIVSTSFFSNLLIHHKFVDLVGRMGENACVWVWLLLASLR
jgi:hypothetical protein